MNEQDFTFWMTAIMVLNIPPQIAAFGLFLWWRRNARRRWIRNTFLLAASVSLLFVLFRTITFALTDDLALRMLTAAVYVAGSYVIIAMFVIATRVMARRMKEQEHAQVLFEMHKTSDILDSVIKELRAETKKYKTARI